ncbi:MAG: hypothetical protein PHO32_04080 [Candidatus Cloacimonetes bacterium]|nr:hypothetical protein [Candidatus Cloacimonadota bacterium]
MESAKYIDELNAIDLNSPDMDWKKDFTQKLTAHKVDGSLIEAVCAAEFMSRYIFDERNIPDDLFKAYHASFGNSGMTLHEHYLQMLENGDSSVSGFVSNLKGKLFEMRLEPMLEEKFTNFDFTISSNPINQVWDLAGVNTVTGEQLLVQAKMGASSYASDVLERMHDNPHVLYALSDDLAHKITSIDPTLADHIFTGGFDSESFTDVTNADLDTLAANMGIDIPDYVEDLLPYVTEIALVIRFLIDIVNVNNDYKNVGASDKTKLYAFKLIMLMTRFGVSAVCVPLGGIIGTTIPVPIAGSVAGAIAGAWFAGKVNKSQKPHFHEVSLWLLGLSSDDLFYMRNKKQIDLIGLSFRDTASPLRS